MHRERTNSFLFLCGLPIFKHKSRKTQEREGWNVRRFPISYPEPSQTSYTEHTRVWVRDWAVFTLNSAVNYVMLQSSQCYSYILNDECKKTSHFAERIFQKLLRKNTFSRSAEELLKVKRFHTELSYSTQVSKRPQEPVLNKRVYRNVN